MKYLSVDSIGEDVVTCEDDDRNKWEISKKKIPSDVREGDVILVSDDGSILIDEEEKRVRQNLATSILDKILNRNMEE